jgi:L-ascorbate metabolism protein UlaG (beta-lactamase superfamily)
LVIDSPGEYEIKGIRINGVARVSDKGLAHVIYVIRAEGLTVVHAGAWSGARVSEALKLSCGNADALCLPISGGLLLDSAQAATVARQLEAAMVIPVMYQGASAQKESGPVARLAKNMNLPVEYRDKLSLRAKSSTPEHGLILALYSQLAK